MLTNDGDYHVERSMIRYAMLLAGWGNSGMLHSSGKLVLMGGGINGPADHNKFVWVGELR